MMITDRLSPKLCDYIFYRYRTRLPRGIIGLAIKYGTTVDILKSQHSRPFVFIHIPKCGGTSVASALSEAGYISSATPGHYTINEHHCLVDTAQLRFITIIREPAERFISAFHYLKKGGGNIYDHNFSMSVLAPFDTPLQVANHMDKDHRFYKDIISWIHFIPQYSFLQGFCKSPFNKIYSLEQIDQVKSDFDIKDQLPSLNSTGYDINQFSEVKNKISAIYESDYTLYRRVINNEDICC